MKKYILILVSLFSLAGCSLKEELMSSSRSEDFYTNTAQCQTGINLLQPDPQPAERSELLVRDRLPDGLHDHELVHVL